MKKIVIVPLLIIALWAEDVGTQVGFERVIAQSKSDACDLAKKNARASYTITEMYPGCRCEKTYAHEWQCDAQFVYKNANKK